MTTEITTRKRMPLTSDNVEHIFVECSRTPMRENIIVRGVVIAAEFDVDKLNARRDDICDMLEELPDVFHVGLGDGWSFANMCINADGEQWTDLHRVCDKLLCLGIAINAAEFTIKQRDLWRMFPGGLPYITIHTSRIKN